MESVLVTVIRGTIPLFFRGTCRVREAKSPRDPRMWSSESLLLGLAAAILVERAGSARTLVVRLWHDEHPPYFF